MAVRWYYVVTPEYEQVVPILDDGTGPVELVSDVAYVEAKNQREALVFGVRELRRDKSKWLRAQTINECSPFTGLKVYAEGDEAWREPATHARALALPH